MITDYATLQTEAMREAQRRGLESVMPSMVQRAEAAIFRELELYQLTVTSQGTTTSGVVPLPADVDRIESLSIDIDSRARELTYVPSDDGLPATGGGSPRRYTVVPGAAQLLPAPGSEYSYTLLYAPKLVPLSDAAPTNWLLLEAPDVYLYRVCMQIGINTHDDALITRHTQFYNDAIQSLRNKDARARLARRGGLRMTPRNAV